VPFQFFETPDSRTSTVNPPTLTLRYKAIGEVSDATVGTYALFATPASVFTPIGQLWRKDLQLTPDGYAQYKVAVNYEQKKHNTGEWTFSFDTTGATFKLKIAREHLGTYFPPGTPLADTNPNHGAIGRKLDGECEGADIVVPALKLSVTFRFPVGIVSIPYVKILAGATGCTNSSPFLGFNAGELLFLGATGADGSSAETEVGFQFAASKNQSGLQLGDITGIVKSGHAYLWVEFEPDVDSGGKSVVSKPLRVNVERVYDAIDFAGTFGWS
jgi:hypothetical protein